MANNPMKRCSAPLAMRKMQISTIVTDNCISMSKIKIVAASNAGIDGKTLRHLYVADGNAGMLRQLWTTLQ